MITPLRQRRENAPVYYVPVCGTWGSADGWVVDDSDAFTLYARYNAGLFPRRQFDGSPWNWPGSLTVFSTAIWKEHGTRLAEFLLTLPYIERNVLAVSHGGQLAQYASLIVPIRTLTTLGTPVRADVPRNASNIGYWQHVYDRRWDFMGTLRKGIGKIGDGQLDLERRFLLPGVVNYGLDDIGHYDVVTKREHFHLWMDNHWFEAMRNGPLLDSVA
jgi:hypothetical protein